MPHAYGHLATAAIFKLARLQMIAAERADFAPLRNSWDYSDFLLILLSQKVAGD
jgi:hypothetical protein